MQIRRRSGARGPRAGGRLHRHAARTGHSVLIARESSGVTPGVRTRAFSSNAGPLLQRARAAGRLHREAARAPLHVGRRHGAGRRPAVAVRAGVLRACWALEAPPRRWTSHVLLLAPVPPAPVLRRASRLACFLISSSVRCRVGARGGIGSACGSGLGFGGAGEVYLGRLLELLARGGQLLGVVGGLLRLALRRDQPRACRPRATYTACA